MKDVFILVEKLGIFEEKEVPKKIFGNIMDGGVLLPSAPPRSSLGKIDSIFFANLAFILKTM